MECTICSNSAQFLAQIYAVYLVANLPDRESVKLRFEDGKEAVYKYTALIWGEVPTDRLAKFGIPDDPYVYSDGHRPIARATPRGVTATDAMPTLPLPATSVPAPLSVAPQCETPLVRPSTSSVPSNPVVVNPSYPELLSRLPALHQPAPIVNTTTPTSASSRATWPVSAYVPYPPPSATVLPSIANLVRAAEGQRPPHTHLPSSNPYAPYSHPTHTSTSATSSPFMR